MADRFIDRRDEFPRSDRVDFEGSLHKNLLDDMIGAAEDKGFDIRGTMDEAEVVWDLGAGGGTGTEVLAGLCSSAKIWAVDPHQEVVTAVKELDRFRQSRLPLQEFIREHQKEADVIYMASLKNIRLDDDDYRALFDAVTPGGIVIETGDTMLHEEKMRKWFGKPMVDWAGSAATANRVWMKIP